MKYATYRQIGGPTGLLARREPFQGNSMSAVGEPSANVDYRCPGAVYVVYSYSTPVAWVGRDGAVHVEDGYWSVTTSRHQNLCRAWLVSPAEAAARMDRERERRADLERRAAEATRRRLDVFLPDVTLDRPRRGRRAAAPRRGRRDHVTTRFHARPVGRERAVCKRAC